MTKIHTLSIPYRSTRQVLVRTWVTAAFGEEQATSPQQRAVRLLEETVEAYQTTGASKEMAHKLIDYVFARPIGDLAQELGGVGVTLLALASAAGLGADACEADEVNRVLNKPLKQFSYRNDVKNAAGFRV